MATPETFVEMQQRQAEALGRLQIGTFQVCRDVVKCRICDESGEIVADIPLPTAGLPRETQRALWNLSVLLSEPLAEAIRDQAARAIMVLADLGGGDPYPPATETAS